MQEAVISINGSLLKDAESETMRVAIGTLANALAEAVVAKELREEGDDCWPCGQL